MTLHECCSAAGVCHNLIYYLSHDERNDNFSKQQIFKYFSE